MAGKEDGILEELLLQVNNFGIALSGCARY
jgi:hypothetical protein